jgi:hypothetical protein
MHAAADNLDKKRQFFWIRVNPYVSPLYALT